MTRARDLSEILNSTGLSVDTDTLVVDSANNRVGIGTDSPGYKLDVEGGANVFEIARFGVSTNNNSQITIGYFDANATNGLPTVIDASEFGGLIQGGDNGHLVLGIRDNDATDALDIVSGGGNFMTDTTYDTLVATFKSNGNVGIGITQPASLLHVQSNDATTNTFVDMLTLTALSTGTTTTGFGPAIKFQAERNNGVMQNVGRIRSVAEINSGTDISSGLAFETSTVGAADEKVRISYDGKVGIGTSSIDGTLHVHTASAGTVTASPQADDLVVESNTETGITIISPDDQSARIRFTSPSTDTDIGGASIFYRQNINKMSMGTEVAGGILTLKSGAGVESITLDASGSVGIGASSVESTLHLQAASAGGRGATLTIDNNATSTVGNESQITFLTDAGASVAGTANARIKAISTNAGDGRAALTFTTWNGSAEDERMRIDSSGNVSIGVFTGTEPAWFGNSDLILNDNAFAFQGKNYDESVFNTSVDAPYTYLTHNGYWNSGWQQHKDGVPVSQLMIGSGSLQFRNAPDAGGTDVPAAGLATKFTIDASGNLLVGKTVNDLTTDGIVLRSSGELFATRANDVAAFNRRSTDGDIVTFRKDGTMVAAIGVNNNDNAYIGATASGHGGFYFGNTNVTPMAAGTRTDDTVDLGTNTYRWQDIHLSGGVVLDENPTIVSTTVAARTIGSKTLDDYEEGTWTTTFGALVNLTGTPVLTEARYTKIGNLVSLSGLITGTTVTSAGTETNIVLDAPFLMVSNSAQHTGSSFWTGSVRQNGLVSPNSNSNSDAIAVLLPGHSWTGNGNLDISFTFTYQSA